MESNDRRAAADRHPDVAEAEGRRVRRAADVPPPDHLVPGRVDADDPGLAGDRDEDAAVRGERGVARVEADLDPRDDLQRARIEADDKVAGVGGYPDGGSGDGERVRADQADGNRPRLVRRRVDAPDVLALA